MRLRKSLAALFVLCVLSCLTWFGCTSANQVGDNPASNPTNPIPDPTTDGTSVGTGTGTAGGGGTSGTSGTTTGTTTGTFKPGDVVTGLNNPTRMTDFGGFVFALVGFNSGQNNGRLIRFALDTTKNTSATDGTQPKNVVASNSSTLAATFTNPFDVISDGLNGALFVTDGFNVNNGGRVLALVPADNPNTNDLEFNITNLTQNATTPQNPSFLLFVPPSTLFFSEFGGTNVGQVRRIDLSDPANPKVVVFANNLNFPADLISDGTFLYVAEAGNRAVVRLALSATGLPLNGSTNGANVQRITSAANANQMNQPFELALNRFGDIYVEEGMGLNLGGLPPLGTANGQIQVILSGATEAIDVGDNTTKLNGLTNPSGLEVIGGFGSTPDRLIFTESIGTPNGDVRNVLVNTGTRAITSNTVIDTGLNEPFDVVTGLPGDATRLFYTVNFQGGNPNGSIRGGSFE